MDEVIHFQLLAAMAVFGVLFGAVAAASNFCTLGALSDWINFGDSRRLRAWVLVAATALAGLAMLCAGAVVDLATSFPPYRSAVLVWPRHLLGGLLFGIGMVLCSGCVSKTLLRLGGGNLKALPVLLIAAGSAYALNWTDLYGRFLDPWLQLGRIEFGTGQGLDQLATPLLAALTPAQRQLALALPLALLAGIWAFASADFRAARGTWLGALALGALVLGAWWLSGAAWGHDWQEWALMSEAPPLRVGTQSFTFVAPLADSAHALRAGLPLAQLSLGQAALAGVLLGALLHALLTRQWRLEWFRHWSDAGNHLLGAVLLGAGGVLAMGCSVGQGIVGISTLALGSFVSLFGIVLGATLTMKIQYRLL